MAKMWLTDLEGRIADRCLQLHGGYGYMWEYPIARAYADARVQRIYGGANEIMKVRGVVHPSPPPPPPGGEQTPPRRGEHATPPGHKAPPL